MPSPSALRWSGPTPGPSSPIDWAYSADAAKMMSLRATPGASFELSGQVDGACAIGRAELVQSAGGQQTCAESLSKGIGAAGGTRRLPKSGGAERKGQTGENGDADVLAAVRKHVDVETSSGEQPYPLPAGIE